MVVAVRANQVVFLRYLFVSVVFCEYKLNIEVSVIITQIFNDLIFKIY